MSCSTCRHLAVDFTPGLLYSDTLHTGVGVGSVSVCSQNTSYSNLSLSTWRHVIALAGYAVGMLKIQTRSGNGKDQLSLMCNQL